MFADRASKPRSVEPKASDVLANERTFLAYVRTSLACIGFGFVIARFGLFLERFAEFTHQKVTTHYSAAFGIAMAAIGVAVGAFGGWRYDATDRGLREGTVRRLTPVAGYMISLVVAAVGLLVAIYLTTAR